MRKYNDLLFKRKGNAVIDTVTILVSLFVLAFFVYILYPVSSDLNDSIQDDPDYDTTAKELMQNSTDSYSSSMDSAFIFLMVLFWLLAIVASFQIDTHPIFFVSSILLLFIVFAVSAELSNSFTEFASEEDYLASVSAMPMTYFVMDHLLIFIIFIGLSITIALYGRSQQ